MSLLKKGNSDIGLLVLRLGAGLMMIFPHGYGKVVNFTNLLNSFPDPLGMGSTMSLIGAVFGEVICSLMIILGIKTRFFSIPALVTMLVAVFVVHGADAWAVKEKAALYALSYVVLILAGGGKYSVRD